MAVFRIEKTRDYTVMSNYHLRDMSLSLKAKGLLSLMLSLPENELELDTMGDRKTALFLIMSDTDTTFNFVIAMLCYTLFKTGSLAKSLFGAH